MLGNLSGNDVSKNVSYIPNGSYYFLVTSVTEMPSDSPASVTQC